MVEMETMVAEAKAALSARLLRQKEFPDGIFRDPAWDMLIDLMVNTLAGRAVNVSSLAIASGVPATTALRYIGLLESQGHIVRHADESDSRVKYLRLSRSTFEKLSRHFGSVRTSRERIQNGLLHDRRRTDQDSVDPVIFSTDVIGLFGRESEQRKFQAD